MLNVCFQLIRECTPRICSTSVLNLRDSHSHPHKQRYLKNMAADKIACSSDISWMIFSSILFFVILLFGILTYDVLRILSFVQSASNSNPYPKTIACQIIHFYLVWLQYHYCTKLIECNPAYPIRTVLGWWKGYAVLGAGGSVLYSLSAFLIFTASSPPLCASS